MILLGDYTKYEDGCEEKAKEVIRKQLHELADALVDVEGFLIVKERDKSGKYLLRQENTMGWKIAIPHMEEWKDT